jgi:hypothetical protein
MTSPGIGVGNDHIEDDVDQQQGDAQQDLFGWTQFFHGLISYFFMRQSLGCNRMSCFITF